MITGPSGPTLVQLGIEKAPQAAPVDKPALPEQIQCALIDAGIDPAATRDYTDLDLLDVAGIGPKGLAAIRAAEEED